MRVHAKARRRAVSHAHTTPSTLTASSLFPHADAAAVISAAFTKKSSDTQGLCQPGCGGPEPGPDVRSSIARAEYGPRAKSNQSPKTEALYLNHTIGAATTITLASQKAGEPRSEERRVGKECRS